MFKRFRGITRVNHELQQAIDANNKRRELSLSRAVTQNINLNTMATRVLPK